MPAIGSSFVFEIRDIQVYVQQTVINVYHFLQDGGAFADAALNVANQWASDVLLDILAIQNTGLEHVRLEVEQLGSLTNYAELALTGQNGTESGGFMPPFVSAPFTYLRSTKETRNGSKRFAGMTDENVTADGFIPTYQNELDALATVLGADLVTGAFTHHPVILGKRYDKTVDPPELLPVAQWVINPISGVQAGTNPTTQNTRKIGRGQ
jgi:hypothetical protein